MMDESSGSSCSVAMCNVPFAAGMHCDVTKEDDITRRFHDKLQRVIFSSHSPHALAVSVSRGAPRYFRSSTLISTLGVVAVPLCGLQHGSN